jgi:hypothetical protein
MFILFFSGYGCVGFQSQSNDRICTKVKDKILMFGINFWNHTLFYNNIQILQNQSFMGELNFNFFRNFTQCKTSFLSQPQPHTNTTKTHHPCHWWVSQINHAFLMWQFNFFQRKLSFRFEIPKFALQVVLYIFEILTTLKENRKTTKIFVILPC